MYRSLKLFVILFGLFFMVNVRADEVYYTNKNGVAMTKQQYDFFTEMYWEGYQDFVTDDIYNKYLSGGYYNGEVVTVVSESDETATSQRGTFHETSAKRLQLSTGCGSNNYCTMVTTLTWKGVPTINSYDVIGSVLYGGNLERVNTPSTYLFWGSNSIEFTDRVYSGDGWGCTVLLPSTSEQLIATQMVEIKVNGDGTFYSSYQHATKKITLETSKKYTTGYGGYGGVFFFYGSAVGVYDQMTGVNTHLAPN